MPVAVLLLLVCAADLVMEYVSGGELFDALVDSGAFSEARAAEVIRQIADAAAFLHAQNLCHADIKPENLLLTDRSANAQVRLVDVSSPPTAPPAVLA